MIEIKVTNTTNQQQPDLFLAFLLSYFCLLRANFVGAPAGAVSGAPVIRVGLKQFKRKNYLQNSGVLSESLL